MPEHDRARQASIANASDECGQRLGGVDGVDEDPLGPGKEPGRLVGRRGGPAVAVTELVVRENDLFRADADAYQRRQAIEDGVDRRSEV